MIKQTFLALFYIIYVVITIKMDYIIIVVIVIKKFTFFFLYHYLLYYYQT
jgi:hypothetical protein